MYIHLCFFQMHEQENVRRLAQLNLRQEEEEDRQADAEYQDFLHQETDRMRQRGFTPRVRIDWMDGYVCLRVGGG